MGTGNLLGLALFILILPSLLSLCIEVGLVITLVSCWSNIYMRYIFGAASLVGAAFLIYYIYDLVKTFV